MAPLVVQKSFKTRVLSAVQRTRTWKVRREFPHTGDRDNKKDVIEVLSEPALVCNSVEDWLQPICFNHMAMRVPRPYTWGDAQTLVDALAESKAFGREDSVQEEVQISIAWGSGQRLAADLTRKAQRLAGLVASRGFPRHLVQQIEEDFRQIGMVMARMAPAKKMLLKLDIMGENGCSRWHQDQYTARAITSYNLSGTEYVNNENVNFWELKNCGNNDHIIRDSSQLYSVEVGDILLMKGTVFPSAARGLVHRSPPKQYHANGKVMHRLLLKVDLP